ncbi:MAG: hypothetical protein PVJ67_01965 [Candidatus Pacearchaeota archaeon]|jgi:hypothetical protein
MIKESAKKTFRVLKMATPIILGILLLLNILNPLFQKYYPLIFTGNYFLDPLIGALGGSIAFGIPFTAYITGGELLKSGVSLLAVAAFVIAWTTVGIAMLPLEIKFLGKKFAILRNTVNFVLAIIISTLTILTLHLLN